MGLFGSIFGKAEQGAGAAGIQARCNECGMTGGSHTAWCPAAHDEKGREAPPAGDRPRPPSTERPA